MKTNVKKQFRCLTTALLLAAAPLCALSLVAMPATAAHAAAPKTYQVTGPVLAIDDAGLTVQKGTEKWEIAKGAATLPEGLKIGDKVTIQYTMTATTVTAKPVKK